MTLSHHYRVHKKGVRHVAFCKTYLSQLRAMLPLPAAQFGQRGSPESDCSTMEESPEAVDGYHQPSRRAFARRRVPRVRETPTRIVPRPTELDPLAAAGAMVFDCRPQVLLGAMDESGTELPEMRSMTRASAAVSQREQSFGGRGDLLGSICPELGVTPLVDPGTDCEDELPAPADWPAVDNTDMDSELQSVFVDVVSLPAMITPVSDVDRALDAPEYVDAVIAPPAVFPATSRPPTATTSGGGGLSRLTPTRPPASVTSERGTPPVVAVPEDFVLFDKAMMSQTQPETSIFPSVCVPSPDVGLVTSGVTPDRTDRLREGPFDAHYERHGSPASQLHSWCRRLRVAYSA